MPAQQTRPSRTTPRDTRPGPANARGFTLLELMAALALLGLLATLIAPNLYSLVPEARLDASARALQSAMTLARSNARIQAKTIAIELDLDHAYYRTVWPPEDQLTSEDVVVRDEDLDFDAQGWRELEPGVRITGAGDFGTSLADKGRYRVQFDAYGYSSDQVIHLQLEGDDKLIWTLVVHGLTGKVDIQQATDGTPFQPDRVDEGNF